LAHLSGAPGEVEVLVVDDDPSDATVAVVEAIATADARSGCFACPRTVAREPRYGLAFDHGSEQARAALQGFLALKGRIMLETKLVVTVGGLAYLANTWSLSGTGPDGNPVVLGATTAEVARRQADGSWRYVVDNAWGDQAVGG
jgi:ketosteroid isomerase-like protein